MKSSGFTKLSRFCLRVENTDLVETQLSLHLDEIEDSYAFFSRFFGKFDALVKVN